MSLWVLARFSRWVSGRHCGCMGCMLRQLVSRSALVVGGGVEVWKRDSCGVDGLVADNICMTRAPSCTHALHCSLQGLRPGLALRSSPNACTVSQRGAYVRDTAFEASQSRRLLLCLRPYHSFDRVYSTSAMDCSIVHHLLLPPYTASVSLESSRKRVAGIIPYLKQHGTTE